MKKILSLLILTLGMVLMSSCERVAPNYAGVLMEDFGKNGKEDFSMMVLPGECYGVLGCEVTVCRV